MKYQTGIDTFDTYIFDTISNSVIVIFGPISISIKLLSIIGHGCRSIASFVRNRFSKLRSRLYTSWFGSKEMVSHLQVHERRVRSACCVARTRACRRRRKRKSVVTNPKQIMRRSCATPRPPNGQFVFADCLYLGTLSRSKIGVSSFL